MELRWRCFWYDDGVNEFALFASGLSLSLSWLFSCVLCLLRLLLLHVSLSDCSHKSCSLLSDAFVPHFEVVHIVL